MYLLDTNTLSYIVRSTSIAARNRYLDMRAQEPIAISSIVEAEVHFGIAKKPRLASLIKLFLVDLEVLPWTQAESALYGALRLRSESIGRRMEAHDLLIAVHAISLNATLVTSDRAFYGVFPELKLEDWATDL